MTIAAVLLFAQAAASPAAQVPSGPWNLEYHEKRCVLSRPFGAGTARRTLAIVSEIGRDAPNLVVTQSDPSSQAGSNFDARVTIDDAPPVTVKAQSDHVAAIGQRVTRVFLDDPLARGIASARRIGIAGRGFDADFAPTGMAKAHAAFDACTRDLMKRVGVDLALRDAVAVKAQPDGDIGPLFGFDNYPPEARRRNESGRAAVLLTIEAGGQVSACRLVETSGSGSLDAKTCELFLNRSRWKAATDAAGNPVRSQLMTAVRWQLAT